MMSVDATTQDLRHLSGFAAAAREASLVLQSLTELEDRVSMAASWCIETFLNGHKILACGNGGSACEAQHLVGELLGHYKDDRLPLAAIAINSDSALLTCIGNDYRFEDVFSRQFQGLALPGDLLIVFTTSGHSPNVLLVLEAARTKGIRSFAFLGRDGGKALSVASISLLVPHADTARIQEGHQFLMHALMDYIEAEFGHV
jgi:D-sedoheptulose 7-phosphate isomerase